MVSAVSKKSFFMESLPILAWSFFDARGALAGFLGSDGENGPLQELALPLRDLGGVHFELLGQPGKGILALDGGYGDLGLEGGGVVSSLSVPSWFGGLAASDIGAETSLIGAS